MLPLAKTASNAGRCTFFGISLSGSNGPWLVVRSSSLWQIGLYWFGHGFLVYAEGERLKLTVTDMDGFDHAYSLVLFVHFDLHDGFCFVVEFRADVTTGMFIILVLMQDGMDMDLPVIRPLHEFGDDVGGFAGGIDVVRKSRMPSMMTNPKSGIVPMACSTIARRSLGENLRRASIIRLSGFLYSGKSAKRKMRFTTCWQ